MEKPMSMLLLMSKALEKIAISINAVAIHFRYHDRSPFGVTLVVKDH